MPKPFQMLTIARKFNFHSPAQRVPNPYFSPITRAALLVVISYLRSLRPGGIDRGEMFQLVEIDQAGNDISP